MALVHALALGWVTLLTLPPTILFSGKSAVMIVAFLPSPASQAHTFFPSGPFFLLFPLPGMVCHTLISFRSLLMCHLLSEFLPASPVWNNSVLTHSCLLVLSPIRAHMQTEAWFSISLPILFFFITFSSS